jgi:hypothetical protein
MGQIEKAEAAEAQGLFEPGWQSWYFVAIV